MLSDLCLLALCFFLKPDSKDSDLFVQDLDFAGCLYFVGSFTIISLLYIVKTFFGSVILFKPREFFSDLRNVADHLLRFVLFDLVSKAGCNQ